MDAITYALSKKYTDNKIAESAGLHRQIVTSLPTTGDEKIIYMVRVSNDNEDSDNYNEYMWIDGNWELIGNTRVDLSDYYNKTQVDTALNNKANTATTLAGYGITDTYTKSEVDTALSGKCEGGSTTAIATSITAQMDALKASGKSGVFPFYISSGNADFSTTGYCMAIGAIRNGGVSTITAVNSQTGDIWTNANTSQVAGDWRGWRKIDAVIDLGSISATSNNDSIGKAWDAITVYEKPVIVRWFYSGSFMALMYKYNNAPYGMAMAMKYNTTDVYTLSVNNGTKTYGNVVSDPIIIRSLNIDVPAVSAGRGCVVHKAFPVISGYKAVGIIGMSCLGNMGTLSLNDFFVNNTEAYVSYNNNTSSATTASAVTVNILYKKT